MLFEEYCKNSNQFTQKEDMFWSENSLSCLKSAVHLPLPPELVKPMTIPGTKQMSVSQDHGAHSVVALWDCRIPTSGKHKVVDQELIVEQDKACDQ